MIRDIPKFVKTVLLLVLLILVGIYVFMNTRIFIQGPKIIINSPEDGFTSENKLIEINGKSLNSTFISINGRPILVDENGNFEEWILLNRGYNVLIFEAHDRFERYISQSLHLVYNEDSHDIVEIIHDASLDNGAKSSNHEEINEEPDPANGDLEVF